MQTATTEPVRLELIEDAKPAASRELAAQPSGALAVPENSPAGMMLAAMARGASLEQVGQMMDLQERWERREAEKAFTQAMTGFKGEPITIYKKKKVSFETRDGDTTSYSHAELSDITEAVVPAMAKHGLSHRWNVAQEGGRIKVDCIVTHSQGHSERVTMDGQPDASGKKNSIQQVASTISYLQRYTLLAITGMSTKGMDDDGAGGKERDSWLRSWLDRIAKAPSVNTLRAITDEAIAEADFENDTDAKDRFLVAHADKMSRAKVPGKTPPTASAPAARPITCSAEDAFSDEDIPH